jgi:Flp pilus assembly protein TadG
MTTRSRSGSALIESALCLLVVLNLLLGIMEFGRIIFAYNSVAFAATEAVRYAAVHGSASRTPATAAVVASVVHAKLIGVPPSAVTTEVTWVPDNKPGAKVTVDVRFTYTPLIPWLLQPVTVRSRTTAGILN